MLFLVSADGDSLDSRISKRFGHSACHLLVDSETLEIRAVSGDVENVQDHGVKRFQMEEITGVISGNIGPHAFEDIKAMGWEVYIIRSVNVRQAVEKVVNGEVEPSTGPSMKRSVHDHQRSGSGTGRGRGGGSGGGGGGRHRHGGSHSS